MADERASPSTCWREVYAAMGVDDDPHEDESDEPDRCPDCGLVVARAADHRCPLAGFEGEEPDAELRPVSSDGGEDD